MRLKNLNSLEKLDILENKIDGANEENKREIKNLQIKQNLIFFNLNDENYFEKIREMNKIFKKLI